MNTTRTVTPLLVLGATALLATTACSTTQVRSEAGHAQDSIDDEDLVPGTSHKYDIDAERPFGRRRPACHTLGMSTLDKIAQPFIDVAHRVVWATVATVDTSNRPRSRVLHPIWEYDGERLTGWIATGPTPVKTAHLAHRPYVSVNYWDAQHDVATAECHITWHHDDATCVRVWEMLKNAPAPVGYDPAMIPVWTEPTQPEFAVLELDPWRLRVFPGTLLLGGEGAVLDWGR